VNADDATPNWPTRAPTNAVTGIVAGPTVQAGTIDGGVHVHQVAPGAAEVVPRQLRPPPRHFTDRAVALADLNQLANTDRPHEGPALAVITGPGGVGKSALALRWLHDVVDRFPDGQLYVDLRANDSERPLSLGSVLAGFLRALGVAGERIPVEASEAAALFRSVTADKRVAVLVDNASSAAQVRMLVPASALSVVIVTSRSRLGGLAMDGAGLVTLTPLEAPAGADLLARTVGGTRVSREPDATATLVELCGGMPIALSIAGARLMIRPGWSVARVVQDLSSEQRRLAALSIDEDVSVRGVFDLSYEDLVPELRRAYRWLGLHPGPHFGVGVASAILRVSVEAATDLLEHLVDASLVQADAADWYQFHDLLRLHARQRAEQEDTAADRDAVMKRILEYYIARAADVDRVIMPLEWRLGPLFATPSHDPPAFTTSAEALDSLEPELPNLMAALRAGVAHDFDDLVWQLCEAAWSLFLYRKHFPDWIAAYQVGIEAAERCRNDAAKSRMHHHLGFAYHNLRRCEEAFEQGNLALAAARATGHGRAESGALALIAMATRELGRYDEAITILRQLVDRDHQAGRPRNEALNRRRLGQTLTAAGHRDEAVQELRHARELAAALPDPPVEAVTTVWLAEALSLVGCGPEALDLLRDAEAALSESGSPQYLAHVLMVRGEVAERLDDVALAHENLTRARDLFTEIGAPHVARVQQVLDRVEPRLVRPPTR
jgi:tetratricopeptide (TPR) repeat protein